MKNTIPSLCLALSMLVWPFTATPSQEVDKTKMSEAHKTAYDSSLALYGRKGEETHFLCSSTVIAREGNIYTLLTAGHCVTGADLPSDLTFFVADEIQDKPNLIPVTVIRAEDSDKYDFALLKLESTKEYIPIKISDSDEPPEVETKVYSVSFALGLTKQVALGAVASKPMEHGADGDCTPCANRYLVHFMQGPGSSGASVIDEKTNKIVGIIELGFSRGNLGPAAETMKSYREWLKTPVETTSPKAQDLQKEKGR